LNIKVLLFDNEVDGIISDVEEYAEDNNVYDIGNNYTKTELFLIRSNPEIFPTDFSRLKC
jgi:hypothetical protein